MVFRSIISEICCKRQLMPWHSRFQNIEALFWYFVATHVVLASVVWPLSASNRRAPRSNGRRRKFTLLLEHIAALQSPALGFCIMSPLANPSGQSCCTPIHVGVQASNGAHEIPVWVHSRFNSESSIVFRIIIVTVPWLSLANMALL